MNKLRKFLAWIFSIGSTVHTHRYRKHKQTSFDGKEWTVVSNNNFDDKDFDKVWDGFDKVMLGFDSMMTECDKMMRNFDRAVEKQAKK